MSNMDAMRSLAGMARYCPETGRFFWIISGDEIHQTLTNGYATICHRGCHIRAHRLAFLIMTGDVPSIIDHANRVKTDNRWSNIRSASASQNCANRTSTGKVSKYGYRGVERKGSRFRARIWCNNKRHRFGYFETAEDAHAAYQLASSNLHGEFSPFGGGSGQ